MTDADKEALERAAVLQRAKTFSGEENPKYCSHVHQRRGTGIFYNSVELIHCFECLGWQSVRRVIL